MVLSETPTSQASLKYKFYMFLHGSHLPINQSQKTMSQVLGTRGSMAQCNPWHLESCMKQEVTIWSSSLTHFRGGSTKNTDTTNTSTIFVCSKKNTTKNLLQNGQRSKNNSARSSKKHTMDTTQQGPKSNNSTIILEQKQCEATKGGEEE